MKVRTVGNRKSILNSENIQNNNRAYESKTSNLHSRVLDLGLEGQPGEDDGSDWRLLLRVRRARDDVDRSQRDPQVWLHHKRRAARRPSRDRSHLLLAHPGFYKVTQILSANSKFKTCDA